MILVYDSSSITCKSALSVRAPDYRFIPDATDVLQQAHAAVDKNLKAIWDSLKTNTMFVVVSLGGNTAYTRWLHELRTKRQGGATGYLPWSPACEEYYLQQLDRSVCGCVWTSVKQ